MDSADHPTPEKWQDRLPPNHLFRNQATTNDERRKARAQWRAKAFISDVEAVLKAYNDANPTDFVMAKMLLSLRSLEKGVERIETALKTSMEVGQRREMVLALARLQKQHIDTLRAIAKYQETTYHAAAKKARGNRSAAPGQQVGVPVNGTTHANTN